MVSCRHVPFSLPGQVPSFEIGQVREQVHVQVWVDWVEVGGVGLGWGWVSWAECRGSHLQRWSSVLGQVPSLGLGQGCSWVLLQARVGWCGLGWGGVGWVRAGWAWAG